MIRSLEFSYAHYEMYYMDSRSESCLILDEIYSRMTNISLKKNVQRCNLPISPKFAHFNHWLWVTTNWICNISGKKWKWSGKKEAFEVGVSMVTIKNIVLIKIRILFLSFTTERDSRVKQKAIFYDFALDLQAGQYGLQRQESSRFL